MFRQLLPGDLVMTIGTLCVEVRTLDGRLVSSRPPTPAEVALAQSAPADLSPLTTDPPRRALA